MNTQLIKDRKSIEVFFSELHLTEGHGTADSADPAFETDVINTPVDDLSTPPCAKDLPTHDLSETAMISPDLQVRIDELKQAKQ